MASSPSSENRRRARTGANVLTIVAVVVVTVLFVAILFYGCQDAQVGADDINPQTPLPGAQDATGAYLPAGVERLLPLV